MKIKVHKEISFILNLKQNLAWRHSDFCLCNNPLFATYILTLPALKDSSTLTRKLQEKRRREQKTENPCSKDNACLWESRNSSVLTAQGKGKKLTVASALRLAEQSGKVMGLKAGTDLQGFSRLHAFYL